MIVHSPPQNQVESLPYYFRFFLVTLQLLLQRDFYHLVQAINAIRKQSFPRDKGFAENET